MGQIDPIHDRIEAASRSGQDKDVYSVSKSESNHMVRMGSDKYPNFRIIKNLQ